MRKTGLVDELTCPLGPSRLIKQDQTSLHAHYLRRFVPSPSENDLWSLSKEGQLFGNDCHTVKSKDEFHDPDSWCVSKHKFASLGVIPTQLSEDKPAMADLKELLLGSRVG